MVSREKVSVQFASVSRSQTERTPFLWRPDPVTQHQSTAGKCKGQVRKRKRPGKPGLGLPRRTGFAAPRSRLARPAVLDWFRLVEDDHRHDDAVLRQSGRLIASNLAAGDKV